MKMVMIVCPENRNEELRELISKHDIHAYTELKEVTGEGATGKKFGSRIWPEKSVLVFTVISNEKKDELVADLRKCSEELFPGEGMRAFVLPVETAI